VKIGLVKTCDFLP